MEFLYLFAGLIILWAGGELLLKGAVEIALKMRISTFLIGLTIVSFGTSAPELLVSLKSVLSGHHDISIGTVVGSNITNIGLILGITALLTVLKIEKTALRFYLPVMIGAGILFYYFIIDYRLSFVESLSFVLLLTLFLFVLYRIGKRENQDKIEQKHEAGYRSVFRSGLLTVAGCIGLAWGADWLVEGAKGIARLLDISERIIALSLVAFGTSLPELFTSLLAVYRNRVDISVGNLIGSNIFNIFGILGITGLVQELSVHEAIIGFDIYWMLGISLLLLPFAIAGKIGKLGGSVLLISYLVYILLIFLQ